MMTKHLQLAFVLILLVAGTLYGGPRSNTAAHAVINELLDSAENIASKNQEVAEHLVVTAEEYSRNLDLQYEFARAQFTKGYINQVNSGGEIGIVSYLNASALLNNIDSYEAKRLNSIALRNVGNIFASYFQYEKSIEYLSQAAAQAKEIGSGSLQRSALFFKARTLRKNNQFLLAIDDLFEASELALMDDDYAFLIKVNNQLGLLFKDIGDYDKSIVHHAEVFVYRDKGISSFPVYAGRSFHNMANVYLLKGDSSKAEEYFLKSIDIRLKANKPQRAFYSFMDVAELYKKQGKLSLAEAYYQKALAAESNLEGKPQRFKIYKQMAELAVLQGNSEAFMKYNDQYTSFLENDLNDNIVVTQTEQLNTINLVTERYFQLVAAKQREEDMKQIAVWVAIISLLSLAGYITITKLRAYRNKMLLEKELKEVMVDLNLDDL